MALALHRSIGVLPCPYADHVTNVAILLPPDKGYSPHFDRSGGGWLRPKGTIPRHRIRGHAKPYRLQWPRTRSDVPVFDTVSDHAQMSRRYCRYRQSGAPAAPFLPALLVLRPVRWSLQSVECPWARPRSPDDCAPRELLLLLYHRTALIPTGPSCYSSSRYLSEQDEKQPLLRSKLALFDVAP